MEEPNIKVVDEDTLTWSAGGVEVTASEEVIDQLASYYEWRDEELRRQVRRVKHLLAWIRSGKVGRSHVIDEIEARLESALYG